MDKKEELIFTLNSRKNQYSKKIHLKGSFFLFENHYYPIKLFFLPSRNEENCNPKELDYGDLLLIEDWIDVNILSKFIDSLGEDYKLPISSRHIKIPKGYLRNLEEDSYKISQLYGGYSSLSDLERKLLKETHSFPKSILRQWPSKVYLFKCQIQNNCNNLYHQKSWKPIPLKERLPAVPEYQTSIKWWLGKELSYLSDWTIAFYLPDFNARIKNVRFAKDRFIVEAEEGMLTMSDLGGKYYIEYENISPETGEVDFPKTNWIQIKDSVGRFYIILYDKKDPSIGIIDYRDYNWKHPYGDREDLDVEYEEENIEYWVSRGENDDNEFKLEIENDKTNKEFLETVCSFSNSYSGRIFIGIDDNGNVKGLDERQIERYQKKIVDLIRNWIEPQVKPKVEVTELREKKIIIVSIPKGNNSPYHYKDHGVYIRVGSTDRIATRYELLSLMPKEDKYFLCR